MLVKLLQSSSILRQGKFSTINHRNLFFISLIGFVEPSDLLAVHPFAFSDNSFLIGPFAQSVFLSIFKGTDILASVGKALGSLSFLEVINESTSVDVAIFEPELTLAFHDSSYPVTCVDATVLEAELAVSVNLVVVEIAFIVAAIDETKFALALLLALVEIAFEA